MASIAFHTFAGALLSLAACNGEPPFGATYSTSSTTTGTDTSATITTTTTNPTTATATATDPTTDSETDTTPTDTTTTTTTTTTTATGGVCGDGTVEGAEDCDDGNDDDGDECPGDCQADCGDGFVHGDEECDDGEEGEEGVSTDACTNECKNALCGDSFVWEGSMEECDSGADNGPDGTCSADCTLNCGDGVTNAAEDCDDGKNGDNLDGCTDECTLRFTVFVTSETYQGDLGKTMGEPTGLDLADLRCQTLADAAGFSGTFGAWLSDSDSTKSPSTRFDTAPQDNDDPGFTGTFALPDGTPVAEGWKGLTTEEVDDPKNVLLHAIDMDDKGSTLTSQGVWSNTTIKGVKKTDDAPEYHCLDWTSIENQMNEKQHGRRGDTNHIDKQWTDARDFPTDCDNPNRLYCFQTALLP